MTWRERRKRILGLYRNRLKRRENVRKKAEIEREFYDQKATYYLKHFSQDFFTYHPEEWYPDRYRKLFSLWGDLRGKAVLDCCCGLGFSSIRCAQAGAKVVSIDLSSKMLAVLKKAISLNGMEGRIRPLQMSAEELAFKGASFDLVIGLGALHHLQPDMAAEEIHRVLRKGGRAIFLEPVNRGKFMISLRSLLPLPCAESPGGGGMSEEDVGKFNRLFSEGHRYEFTLLERIAHLPHLGKLSDPFSQLDNFLFQFLPFLRRFAFTLVLEFVK